MSSLVLLSSCWGRESWWIYLNCSLLLVGWLSRLNWRLGGDQSTTLNVIFQNVCHTLKFMNLPGYSGHCWCELRNPRWRPRWPPEINTKGCCVRIDVLIWCILFHQINDIYFCSVCLNFLMIHLNMVSISRSRSNSRSNTKNSEKGLIS